MNEHAPRFKVGDTVLIARRKRTIVSFLPDVQGGIELDKPIEGFRYWNIADASVYRPLSKYSKPPSP